VTTRHEPNPYRALLLIGVPWIALLALLFRSGALAGLAIALGLLAARARQRARGALAGLEARREVYASAFEGDSVAVDLHLENRSRRAAFLVEVGDAFGPGIGDRQLLLEPGPLPPASRRHLRYRAHCTRDWGVYAVGPVSLRAADPFGLFPVERGLGQLEPFAVFPRVHDVAGLERLGARPSLTPQDVTSARPGQSAAYLGVREYRSGDDLRRVHWPATARQGRPVVKEYEVDLTPYFTLFVDLDRRNRAGTGRKSILEYLVRSAASLLWSATRHGHVVQVLGAGLFVPPGRGELHLTHALYELIRVRQAADLELLEAVEAHLPHLLPGSTATLLFGTIAVDAGRLEALLETLRSRAVRPLLFFVNGETFLPIERWPMPASAMRARREVLAALLRSRGTAGAILEASQDLGTELGRSDLLEAAS
jgi:uncharacterized protein (DUF58 family)